MSKYGVASEDALVVACIVSLLMKVVVVVRYSYSNGEKLPLKGISHHQSKINSASATPPN